MAAIPLRARWFVCRVNPDPWAIGPVSVGRRGGKLYPIVGRNEQLATYQEAIRSEVGLQPFIVGGVGLHFYFWREVPEERKYRKHDADATNLQKATEDALQGLLFDNDRLVVEVGSTLVHQGPDVIGQVVIAVWDEPQTFDALMEIPPAVWEQMKERPEEPDDGPYDDNVRELF